MDRAWFRSPRFAAKLEQDLQKKIDEWPKRRALGPELAAIGAHRCVIKELNWLNIFGPPYVELFGRERLLAKKGKAAERRTLDNFYNKLDNIMNNLDKSRSFPPKERNSGNQSL